MKKLLSILLVVVLVALSIPHFVDASGETEPQFSVSSATGVSGDTVRISLDVLHNPGITSLQVQAEYSEKDLELVSVEDPKLFGEALSFGQKETSPLTISWFSSESKDMYEDGTLVVMEFRIKEEAENSTISLSYDPENVFDISMTNVFFQTQDGYVTISSETDEALGTPDVSEAPEAISSERPLTTPTFQETETAAPLLETIPDEEETKPIVAAPTLPVTRVEGTAVPADMSQILIQATASVFPDISSAPLQTVLPSPTVKPTAKATATARPTAKATATVKPSAEQSETTAAPKSQKNPCTKVRSAKRVYTVRKGKTANSTFYITRKNSSRMTTDKVRVSVSNKSIVRIMGRVLYKTKVKVRVKGVKKGIAKLNVKVGSKKSSAKIRVVR